jgi:F0F1-type ATP synthase delta subunit
VSHLPDFVLPPTIVGRADAARLIREIEAVDSELEKQKVGAKTAGHENVNYELPDLSQGLNDLVEANQFDLNEERLRRDLKLQLQRLKDEAPALHMTFATEADPASLAPLIKWIRINLDPHTLLNVGLQPSLVGGAVLRTNNHFFDFTLRAHLQNQRGIVMRELEALKNG